MTTLARRQVAQYTNVLSRYNKDPSTSTLTAAQIRLMVDRFSVVRKAEPPPIFSLDSHAKAYETLIRRIVINPMFRNLRTGLSQAVALREALEIIQGIDISPRRSLLVDEEVNAYFAKVNRWHERKMIATFKESLGVDISGELSIVETQATMDRFRRDNVSLIKTIPPRMHESLFNRMSEVFAEKPFSRAAMGMLVREEFGSVGFNARRIARDQVSKSHRPAQSCASDWCWYRAVQVADKSGQSGCDRRTRQTRARCLIGMTRRPLVPPELKFNAAVRLSQKFLKP